MKLVVSFTAFMVLLMGCASNDPATQVVTVRAVLLAKPEPHSMHPYVSTLSWCAYRRVDSGETILVSHWAYLNGQADQSYSALIVGSTNSLTLIPSEHVQDLYNRHPSHDAKVEDFLGAPWFHAVFYPLRYHKRKDPNQKMHRTP